MAEYVLHNAESIFIRLMRWLDKNLWTRSLGMAVAVFVATGFSLYAYVNVTGDTNLIVTGDNNEITIPRAPQEITPQTIACKGAVEVISRSAANGYRAIYSVLEDDGISTTYFLSLSLDAQGQPVSQFSVNWERGDGSPGGPPGGTFVPVDAKTLKCLQERAR